MTSRRYNTLTDHRPMWLPACICFYVHACTHACPRTSFRHVSPTWGSDVESLRRPGNIQSYAVVQDHHRCCCQILWQSLHRLRHKNGNWESQKDVKQMFGWSRPKSWQREKRNCIYNKWMSAIQSLLIILCLWVKGQVIRLSDLRDRRVTPRTYVHNAFSTKCLEFIFAMLMCTARHNVHKCIIRTQTITCYTCQQLKHKLEQLHVVCVNISSIWLLAFASTFVEYTCIIKSSLTAPE